MPKQKKRPAEQTKRPRDKSKEALPPLPTSVPRWSAWMGVAFVLLAVSLVVFCGLRWGPMLLAALTTIMIITVGRWATGAPRFAVTIARWAWAWPKAWFGAIALVLLLGGAGTAVVRRDAERCTSGQQEVENRLAEGDTMGARAAFGFRCTSCDPSLLGELDRKVAAAEKAEAEQRARKAADEREAKLAAKERDAVADFPEDAATLRRSLKEAAGAVARNDVKSAAMAVTSARTILDTYRGTSVEESADWRELDAQERALRTKVQPYLDAQRVLVEQVQTQIAEQAAQDRRDGVKLTREGWIAAASPEKLEQVSKYKAAGDEEGITLLLRADPDVVKLKDGIRVVVIEQVGVLNRYVRVRVKGTLTELWTYPEALRDP